MTCPCVHDLFYKQQRGKAQFKVLLMNCGEQTRGEHLKAQTCCTLQKLVKYSTLPTESTDSTQQYVCTPSKKTGILNMLSQMQSCSPNIKPYQQMVTNMATTDITNILYM